MIGPIIGIRVGPSNGPTVGLLDRQVQSSGSAPPPAPTLVSMTQSPSPMVLKTLP